MLDRLKAIGRIIDKTLTGVGAIIYYGLAFVAVLVVIIYAIPLIEGAMYLGALLWFVGGLLLVVAILAVEGWKRISRR
jgi:hypothetical protein